MLISPFCINPVLIMLQTIYQKFLSARLNFLCFFFCNQHYVYLIFDWFIFHKSVSQSVDRNVIDNSLTNYVDLG